MREYKVALVQYVFSILQEKKNKYCTKMNDDEKKGYQMGVENTLALFEALTVAKIENLIETLTEMCKDPTLAKEYVDDLHITLRCIDGLLER